MSLTLSLVANYAGFIGAVIILCGYGWQTFRNAAPDLAYLLANFVGAALLAFSLAINVNLPALCLEIAWTGLALIGLVRHWRAA